MRAYGSKRVNVDRPEPIVDELHIRAANLGQFEAYWASCLSLPHVGAVARVAIGLNGIDPEGDLAPTLKFSLVQQLPQLFGSISA